MSENADARSELVNAIACAVDDSEIALLVEDAIAAAEERVRRRGITPADARALYAALRNIAWPANEIEAASAKLKAIGESDGVAVWNPRRSRNDGPELGWVTPRDSGKEKT